MKKIFAIILAVLMLLPCLAACAEDGGKASDIKDLIESSGADETDATDENIIRPLVRNSKNPSKAMYGLTPEEDIQHFCEEAEIIARVKITNWLGDSEHYNKTNFDVEIIEVYKGDVSEGVVVVQSGTTECTFDEYPFFTYGNEMILFFTKMSTSLEPYKDRYPDIEYPDYDYENGYLMMGGPLNTWCVATLENGNSYVVPYFPWTSLTNELINEGGCKNLGSLSEAGCTEDARAAVKKIYEIDGNAISLLSDEYVFELSEFEDYIESFVE